MGRYSPVVVFTYNRLHHTQQTLNALNECEFASETDLYIFCDSYKSDAGRKAVEDVRCFVDSFARQSRFKHIAVTKALTNKGLAKSIIDGVSEIIEKNGKVIVVEDDLVASKYFLRYMNEALEFYENDQSIWAISGYSFPMVALKQYEHDVYLSGRGCSWGWATWSNRWNTIDWSAKEYDRFKHNWLLRKQFGSWGADLPPLLDYQMNLDVNSWAVKWCFSAFNQGKMTVYPKRSYLKNCGIDGTGVHSKNTTTTRFDTFYDDAQDYSCKFERTQIDKTIQKEFAKKYSLGLLDDLKEQVKAFLVRNHLWRRL